MDKKTKTKEKESRRDVVWTNIGQNVKDHVE